mmetsp:Transcript_20572/g.51805  ORF Transcript_20572/g.51805 Transcript_20572/m.51805 type:complete len:354 (+) Transcript_20572:473-1534(+)|eukprot:jgi/Tetstr1/426826/TSEL_017041.t1
MADDHTTVLVTADTAKSGASNLCVRYFTSVTPKDEGSVVFGHAEGESVTGTQLRALLENKGIPLENHHPQAYVDAIGGYCNLDDDLVLQLTGEGQGPMRVDVRFTPLAGPMGEMGEEPSTAPKPAAAPVLANPGPMALFAFAMTTCMLMLIETGAVESLSINLVIGFAMFHGGLVQLVVGFIEIYRNNLFGATAFASYGAFWMGFALTHILEAGGVLEAGPYHAARAAWLSIWGIFTSIMFVQTIYINFCLQAIFFQLALAFFLLAGGEYNQGSKMGGGVVGIILAATVVYTATAELYNDLGSLHLPLGHVNTHKAEFGNSKPGRGAILSKADPAGVVALRTRKSLDAPGKQE